MLLFKLNHSLTSKEQKESRKISRVAATYNMLPNLLWTALFLLPAFFYCYKLMTPKTAYILLGVCMVPLFFPNSFFDRIQISRSTTFYKRIGVKYVNKFAQNGELLNRYLRKKYPAFKTTSPTKTSIRKQFYQTYFFEKFHFSLFLFFTAITIYAMSHGQLIWAIVLSVCNLLYNIYPNLLQQYIRLKLISAMKRS